MKSQLPIDGKYTVSCPLGWRTHPITGLKSHHNGVDLCTATAPTWIEVPFDGVVIASAFSASAGNYVIIRHRIRGKLYCTKYMHMMDGSIQVRRFQRVKAGQPIGKMGATGQVTGRHLHFEVSKGANYVWSATGQNFLDPIAFCKEVMAFEANDKTGKK